MAMPMPDPEYGQLLAELQPRRIHNKKQHAYYLRHIETLMLKGDDRIQAEDTALELLVKLVHDYEQEHFPLKRQDPAAMLAYLMEENNLKPSDLPIPASRVSEILHNKRAISKAQALLLAERFKVQPALFLGL
jgi:HTH-type transcriptional regulator/antitoxin HigA